MRLVLFRLCQVIQGAFHERDFSQIRIQNF